MLVVDVALYRHACWRCGATCVVWFAESDGLDTEEVEECSLSRPVTAAARELWYRLPNAERAAYPLAVVKPRFSKTVGYEYLSAGCPACDALFGSFFLFTEARLECYSGDELPLVGASVGLDKEYTREDFYEILDADQVVVYSVRPSPPPPPLLVSP